MTALYLNLLLTPLLTTALLSTTPSTILRTSHITNHDLRPKRTTKLHQYQVLQPQKGGIVVESPSDGFIARDILLDEMMGRSGDGSSSSSVDSGFDDVILGGNPTFTSRSSGVFAPTPPQQQSSNNDLPLFPDLKSMQQSSSGPRRISPGESAVFERAVTRNNNSSVRNTVSSSARRDNGSSVRAGYGSIAGNQGSNNFGKGGVSIKGDSSIFSSTGFVGGGGSTNVYSGGASASNTGRYSSSNNNNSSFNKGVKNSNVGNSFRDGTGRDYSSSSFGNNMARNAGKVSIKGDSSIFSSTGFVDNGSSSGYGGIKTQSNAKPTYNSQHVFDAPSYSENAYSTPSTSYEQKSNNNAYSPAMSNGTPTYNTGESISNAYPNSNSITPPPKNYNSGQSLSDNFLTTKHSVRRPGPMPNDDDDDYDPDDEMLGYDSPTRRGDSFLTEPEPQFVNMPIHTGKWISELYSEQGLDLLSGGMEGFGVVRGEVQKGSSGGGGGNFGSSSGYQRSQGFDSGSGYGSDGFGSSYDGYGGDNSGYGNSNGYGSDNSGYVNNGYQNGNGGYQSGGSFDRFGHTPAHGY